MITSSIVADLSGLRDLLGFKQNISQIQRELASSILAEIIPRIHVQGKNGDGSQIGEYSEEYLKIRSGNFQKKKKNKEGKPAKTRAVYGRGSDPKVVLSLTRRLEKSYQIIQLNDNSYAIENPNFTEIIEGLENKYGGGIYKLTKEETEKVYLFVNEKLNEYIKNAS